LGQRNKDGMGRTWVGRSGRTRSASPCAWMADAIRVLALAVALLLLIGVLPAGRVGATETESPSATPLRLISLNPSLTAIVVRLGAGDSLVGIDDYSAQVLPELSDLPRVGGLFDPNLEAVVALKPDRVLIVAGVDQETHAARIKKLGLEVEVYANERLDEVLENITRLGRLLGREDVAARRKAEILATRRAVTAATADRPRPATVAIVDRSPLYLVGAETFLDEMLESVGATNLVRRLPAGYPRGSIEWLIAARPELLLDMTPGADEASKFWSRWPSLPAVSAGRVISVEASRVSMPGPDLDDALRSLAVVVHGPEIEQAIDRALEANANADDERTP